MSAAAIAWLPWGAGAFARARAENRPVLLAVTARWCPFSAEMERTSYADERVVALVSRTVVPVRVDADRRPDVSVRYGLGGWPTTVLLTPEGEMLCGGTMVSADRLATVLRQACTAYAAGDHARAPRMQVTPQGPSSASPAEILETVLGGFDERYGGFGDRLKFPHTAPIRLALDLHREGVSSPWQEVAITTLDAMGWGPLHDEARGGFYRCARDRDWGRPFTEKLLEVNAALLAAYVDAFETLHLARYAERAEDVLRYVQAWLADPMEGGWAASERADPYGNTAGSAPSASGAETIDRTLYVDGNARMVSAALQASWVLQDPALAEFAIRTLERIVLLCYRPGAGVAHYAVPEPEPNGVGCDEDVRGLLDDHVALATASLDAFETTGNIVYQMLAEELTLHATGTMWDDRHGGFFDRAADPRSDVGLLREPVKPFVTNCSAARMLRRLARTNGSPAFATCADRTLTAMEPRAIAEGPLAAEYVLAIRESGR